MKKSEAEKAADLHESELDRLRITRTPSYHYLAGVKYAIEQAEKMAFPLNLVTLEDLRKLLETTL